MNRRIFLLLVLASALAPFACGPRTPQVRRQRPPIRVVDPEEAWEQARARSAAVAVQGRYAYVGIDRRLVVVDVADPRRPAVVGHAGLWPDYWPIQRVSGVAVSGKQTYVVYDITSGLKPKHDLAVLGQHAFIAEGRGGLEIADISNPAAPRGVGSFDPRPIAAGAGQVRKAK